jgi:DnaJ-class molecular chaperone
MHKVDPIQIMLSDIFEKVFYKRASNVKECPECVGEGVIQRDEGDIDLAFVTCEECGGTGEPRTTICLECEGTGAAFIEVARPQNFDRDIGYLDEEVIEGGCEECGGTGLVEDEE